MKKLAAAAFFLTLAACASPEPPLDPIRLDFSRLPKFALNTQDVRIINRTDSTPRYAPYVGHLYQPTLADAIQHMAGERLHAAGTLGHATFIIKDANVTEQSLATTSGIEGLFTRDQASKMIGRVEVSLEAQSPVDASIGQATAMAVYAVTLPEDPTPLEKHEAYRKLITSIMGELNKELDRSVAQHMGRFLTNGETENAAPTQDSRLPRPAY